jgi:hypothetical protein
MSRSFSVSDQFGPTFPASRVDDVLLIRRVARCWPKEEMNDSHTHTTPLPPIPTVVFLTTLSTRWSQACQQNHYHPVCVTSVPLRLYRFVWRGSRAERSIRPDGLRKRALISDNPLRASPPLSYALCAVMIGIDILLIIDRQRFLYHC